MSCFTKELTERELAIWRLGRQEYRHTALLQEQLVTLRRAEQIPDVLLLLEHEPVITVGQSAKEKLFNFSALPCDDAQNMSHKEILLEGSLPIVETSRGGQATYHGPGQLVVYPIIDLRRWRRDVHLYLRHLEAVGIQTLHYLGLPAGNKEGHTGVWIQGRKIASIGIAVKGWITYHGMALNVNCDMAGFARIHPCGLSPQMMTSLAELGLKLTVAEIMPLVEKAFVEIFAYRKCRDFNETEKIFLLLQEQTTTINNS